MEVHALSRRGGELLHASESDERCSTIDMVTPSSQRGVVERCFEHTKQVDSSKSAVGLYIFGRRNCFVGHLDSLKVPACRFTFQTRVHVEIGYTGNAQRCHCRRDERMEAVRRQMLLVLY